MKLGILVNSDRHLAHVVGLTRAAVARGHAVSLFAMDTGTRLLQDPACLALGGLAGVTISVCEHSAKEHDVPVAGLPAGIVSGSQYQNAVMVNGADRVIVL